MENKYSFKLIVPAILFGMVLAVPAYAQSPNAPASQQMHDAGENVEQAGADTGAAAKDAYHGTVRAVKDTTITAEVKTALARDKNVSASAIHVDTSCRHRHSEGQSALARDGGACHARRGACRWRQEREQSADGRQQICEQRLAATAKSEPSLIHAHDLVNSAAARLRTQSC